MTTERHDLPRVLCVDDDPSYLEALKIQLRRSCQVVTATCGEQGLSELERGSPFAVVISDLRMPSMDGLSFLGQVRDRWPSTTRILLTGATYQDAVPEGRLFFAWLGKPCPRSELHAAVEAAVREHKKVHLKNERPGTDGAI